MGQDTTTYLIDFLGFGGFLWIGLYVVTRGDRGRMAYLTGGTAVATSCFFFFNCWLKSVHGDAAVSLNRWSWWASILPATLWLQLSLDLGPQVLRVHWRVLVARANLAAAAVLIALGTFTNMERDYAHPTAQRPVDSGPIFAFYVAYMVACLAIAAANLGRICLAGMQDVHALDMTAGDEGAASAQRLRTSEVVQLVIAALFFLIGAGYLALNELEDAHRDQWPGLLLLLIGLGVAGATVVLRSAVLFGKDLRRDSLHGFVAYGTVILPALAILTWLVGFGDGRRCLAALLVVATITAAQALHESLHEGLDLLFFPPAVRDARAAARAYEQALATPPAGASPALATRKAFDDAVRRAITHLQDPTWLATSSLVQLQAVGKRLAESGQEDNRLDRAAALKEILLELLDGLRPNGRTGGVTSDAYRYYNCLYYPYVQGISRRRLPALQRRLQERRAQEGSTKSDHERVVDWLLLQDDATFYRWQRRASDTLAAALREREVAAGGAVPEAEPASVSGI